MDHCLRRQELSGSGYDHLALDGFGVWSFLFSPDGGTLASGYTTPAAMKGGLMNTTLMSKIC